MLQTHSKTNQLLPNHWNLIKYYEIFKIIENATTSLKSCHMLPNPKQIYCQMLPNHWKYIKWLQILKIIANVSKSWKSYHMLQKLWNPMQWCKIYKIDLKTCASMNSRHMLLNLWKSSDMFTNPKTKKLLPTVATSFK